MFSTIWMSQLKVSIKINPLPNWTLIHFLTMKTYADFPYKFVSSLEWFAMDYMKLCSCEFVYVWVCLFVCLFVSKSIKTLYVLCVNIKWTIELLRIKDIIGKKRWYLKLCTYLTHINIEILPYVWNLSLYFVYKTLVAINILKRRGQLQGCSLSY